MYIFNFFSSYFKLNRDTWRFIQLFDIMKRSSDIQSEYITINHFFFHLVFCICWQSFPCSTRSVIHCLLKLDYGGFHLHLLVLPFVYLFSSRIGVLTHSLFANDLFKRISTTFQQHFKICFLWFLHEKECSFYTHLF